MRPSKKPVRQLKFACDLSWESMQRSEGGRFCDSCRKPVIDFTMKSKEELRSWFRSGAPGCGRFAVDQLDPSLVPIEEIGRGVRRGLFAAIAAFAIGSAPAQVVEPAAPTEKVDDGPREQTNSVSLDAAATVRNPKLDRKTCPPIEATPTRKVKKHTYLSWRFPFVHRHVTRNRMGFF